jgi:CheY-like chemotaxis protein
MGDATQVRKSTSADSFVRILVVEDDPVFCRILLSLLEGEGYRVDFATTLEESIQCLDNRYYNLALLDIQLPDGSGLSLANRLLNTYHVPFLVLTVSKDASFIRKATSLFALDYILKPIEPAQFLITIRTALANARNIENLKTAVRVHETVGIAVGIMMHVQGWSHSECLMQVRRFASDNNYSLHAICEFVVALFDRLSTNRDGGVRRPAEVQDIFDAYKRFRAQP